MEKLQTESPDDRPLGQLPLISTAHVAISLNASSASARTVESSAFLSKRSRPLPSRSPFAEAARARAARA
jgi:hypothetical protein